MSDNYGDVVKLPSQTPVSDQVRPSDILASYSPPPTVKGGTFRGGSGVIAGGTVVAKVTASGLFVPYDDASVEGGVATAVGVTYETIDTGADAGVNFAGNVILSGTLKHDQLTGLNAAGIADLNGRVVGHLNQFKF